MVDAEDLLELLFSEEVEEGVPQKVEPPKPPPVPKKAVETKRQEKQVEKLEEKKKPPRLKKMMIAHEIFSLPVSLRRR
jgi:hypothetical protein